MLLSSSPAGKTGWPWTRDESLLTNPLTSYPKISIVTPTYRHGHYLEETMRSVFSQDYPNLEYIVIDGGSADETVSLLERYDEQLSYWASEPDRGHAHALNKGFACATGEILAWINAGDFYFPQALHRVAQTFQSFPEITWLTAAQQGHFSEKSEIYTLFTPGFSKSFFMAGGYLGFEPFALDFIQQESTFWRKSLWERAGSHLNESLRMANDFELWRRFFTYADLALLDAPLGCFRHHADQRSASQAALYQQEAWACLGRKGNSLLSYAYRIFKKLRLDERLEWRDALRPFYQQELRFVTFDVTGNLQCKRRKLI
ncbi:MAG: glycosyltransferase [Acidobacteria bacterium]|nr:glycosyltransferase [Acidobacteriota bacterium]